MPKLGLTMKSGKIAKWFKKEGEKVEQGESLLKIETDKIVIDVKSPDSGILRKVIVPHGATVPVLEKIAIIAEPDEEIPEEVLAYEEEKVDLPEREEVVAKEKLPARLLGDRKPRITPVARKLAEEHQIDILKIHGSGPSGRIVKVDILKAIEEAAMLVQEGAKVAKVVEMSTMRNTIAERMTKSHLTAAQVTMTAEVDMTEAASLLKKFASEIEKSIGVRLSFTDIIIKAVAEALKEHPILNATLEDSQIKIFEDIHIGFALALEEGLVVPVIRHARRSLREIARTRVELTRRAREGTLTLEEIRGSTFTVTNLGMFGIDVFTPIINPPEVAIMGIGRILDKPVVVEGQIVIKKMMPLSLTVDHRVVDGVPAAKFLQRIVQILKNPHFLFVQ